MGRGFKPDCRGALYSGPLSFISVLMKDKGHAVQNNTKGNERSSFITWVDHQLARNGHSLVVESIHCGCMWSAEVQMTAECTIMDIMSLSTSDAHGVRRGGSAITIIRVVHHTYQTWRSPLSGCYSTVNRASTYYCYCYFKCFRPAKINQLQ